jgi:hypothetical protein
MYASTDESEIVTCRFVDGSELLLFCKYGIGHLDRGSARRGVPYEGEVYRRVLDRLQLSTPRFHSTHADQTTGCTWLVLEYLDGYLRVNQTAETYAMRLTARWIGRFHAITERLLSSAFVSFLNNYDYGYYAAWQTQMSMIPDRLKRSFSWLADLCKHSEGFIEPLATASPTVLHGEFYPSNALIRDGVVSVVDWESAGLGSGELDLAALTQGPWPEDVVLGCEEEYRLARWPKGCPADFTRTLTAARLYFAFRLLFHYLVFRPDRVAQQVWLFEHMRSAGELLGLI